MPAEVDVTELLAAADAADAAAAAAADDAWRALAERQGLATARDAIDDAVPRVLAAVGPMFAAAAAPDEPAWARQAAPSVPRAIAFLAGAARPAALHAAWPRLSAIALQFLDHHLPEHKGCGCRVLSALVRHVDALTLHSAGLLLLYRDTAQRATLLQDLALTRAAVACESEAIAALLQASELLRAQAPARPLRLARVRQPLQPPEHETEAAQLAAHALALRIALLERLAQAVPTEQRLAWLELLAELIGGQVRLLSWDCTCLLLTLVPALCALLECGHAPACASAADALARLCETCPERMPVYRGRVLASLGAACYSIAADEPAAAQALRRLLDALRRCCGAQHMQADWEALSALDGVRRVLSVA